MPTPNFSKRMFKEYIWRGFKPCSNCKVIRPLFCFTKATHNKLGYQSECKFCRANKEKIKRKDKNHKERVKRYKQEPKNRRRTKDLALQRLFGINILQYEEILLKQNNKCAICKMTEHCDDRKNALAVDHCHTTGKVRGLLCSNCNLGIGNMKDNIAILENAIKYLKEHSNE